MGSLSDTVIADGYLQYSSDSLDVNARGDRTLLRLIVSILLSMRFEFEGGARDRVKRWGRLRLGTLHLHTAPRLATRTGTTGISFNQFNVPNSSQYYPCNRRWKR